MSDDGHAAHEEKTLPSAKVLFVFMSTDLFHALCFRLCSVGRHAERSLAQISSKSNDIEEEVRQPHQ
jgi:hypothetical protein